MFEITLSTDRSKSKDISLIINRLRSPIKNAKGIMVCEEYDQRIKLALAVRKEKKDYILGFIFDAICEAIIRSYKEQYFLNHLKITLSSSVAMMTFIKALTMFDKAGDKEIIKKYLKPASEIYIDSLYHFRLWELDKRWQDICDLVYENSSYLLLNGTFIELMRFLVLSGESEAGEIHVYENGNKIYALNKDGNEVFNIKYLKDDDSKISVLSELICLLPEKIVLHENEFDRELKHFISSLFVGKVSIIE